MLLLFSRDSDFLFSVWAWCGEGRVSPKGETGGIHSVVILIFVVLKMDSVLRKLFSGDFDFRKIETNLNLHFVRAEEGSGEESARASEFFWRLYLLLLSSSFSSSLKVSSRNFTSIESLVFALSNFFLSPYSDSEKS